MKHRNGLCNCFGILFIIFANTFIYSNEKSMELNNGFCGKSELHSSNDFQKVQKLGFRLENDMLTFVKNQQVAQYSKRISPIFQGGHTIKGTTNRQQEIALIKMIDIHSYVISNFFATRCSNTLVCSYYLETTEFLFGQFVTSNALRISVWKKNHKGLWQWISHSNFVMWE